MFLEDLGFGCAPPKARSDTLIWRDKACPRIQRRSRETGPTEEESRDEPLTS